MNINKYTECLNDLMDYFILADVQRLSQFSSENALSDDLMTEFTTNDSGEKAVESGVIIPMRGIENYPYTVYFNESSDSVFSAQNSDLQHRKGGYLIEVTSSRLHLLTMPLLRAWSKSVGFIESGTPGKPFFDLENGWYAVEILCGETQQESGWEPTIEFLFEPRETKPVYGANVDYSFHISAREY